MLRLFAISLISLLASGCALHAGGLSYTVGQSGICDGNYTETTEMYRCEGTYVHGGEVSQNFGAMLEGSIDTARRGAGAALGVPVP